MCCGNMLCLFCMTFGELESWGLACQISLVVVDFVIKFCKKKKKKKTNYLYLARLNHIVVVSGQKGL